MSMNPRLWSINALSTELDIDRRTVARRLRKVPPAGKLNGHDAWHLADVLPILIGGKVPQKRPEPPLGYRALEDVANPFNQGALAMHLAMIYLAPVLTAHAVVENGGSMDLAFRASQEGTMMWVIQSLKQARADGYSWAGENVIITFRTIRDDFPA